MALVQFASDDDISVTYNVWMLLEYVNQLTASQGQRESRTTQMLSKLNTLSLLTPYVTT